MSGRYVKKPVTVDAFQWKGQPKEEWPDWFVEEWPRMSMGSVDGCAVLVIPTLEGVMQAAYGDWIICGIRGEIYPCKPDIFEQTYEAVT